MRTTFPDRHRHGVTLVETILVITLLAAASVSGLLMFDEQWLDRRGAKATTAEVAQLLTTARNSSINCQSTVRVTHRIDSGHQYLVISRDPGPFQDGETRLFDLGTESRISGNPATIEFVPNGTAKQKLQWKISHHDVAGEVTVAPVSGQISRVLP
jgi:Tfp pilus assembly protein FimT